MNTSPAYSYKPKERHIFAGCHTPNGFRSYLEYILPVSSTRRIYILKGGTTDCRSEILYKIAEGMLVKGLRAEIMHDPINANKIDCVSFPDNGIALFCSNLNDFTGIRCNEVEVNNLFIEDLHDRTPELSNEYYDRAYRYLRAAVSAIKEAEERYISNIDLARLLEIAEGISVKLFENYPDNNTGEHKVRGNIRRLFSSAVTPDGVINLKDSVLSGIKTIIGIKGRHEGVTGTMLSIIAEKAVNKGYNIEVFHSSLFPDIIEHITIPSISSAISTISRNELCKAQNTYMQNKTKYGSIIDPDEYRISCRTSAAAGTGTGSCVCSNTEVLAEEEVADRLIDMAVAALSDARRLREAGEKDIPSGIFLEFNIDETVSDIISKLF